MTGNISYLSDYEPYNGGYVSFGQGGGKITGKDHLGKFDAKGDEGYFIGYSMSSKAFRVFNKRTKKLEENMHVDFLKNKLIEKGAGLNWLFDIDTLTNSMNYVPVVVAGKSSTNFSGTKDVSSQDVKKDVSSLRYIALLNWFHEAHLESSTSNAQDTCNAAAPESNGNSNPTATSKNPSADQMETLTVKYVIPIVSSYVPTACLDDSLETSSDTRLISKGVPSQEETPSLDNILTLSNMFEDILGVYQMDVKSAFLYGTIDEEVYLMHPPGFQDPEFLDRVYKVKKAMYGLHQAPRAWYGTLSKYLLANGFQRGTIDQTLFIRKHRGYFLLVQVYVDDIIFGSSNPQLCREFKGLIYEKFQMSAMVELNFFLGLQVLQKKDGIFLSQYKYVGDILKKFGYSDGRSANTPMDKENLWGKDGPDKDVELHLYRSMIGSLMYLTASRPDIMFAVYSDYGGATQGRKSTTGGCQFLGRRLISWQCKKQTIVATSTTEAKYVAAASGCKQVLKSTTGGCQFLGRRLISWQCKKQTIVATSTTEAKYVAAASGCNQVLWIQNQMLDYGHHFIRDCYEKKLINVDHIHTDDNVADLLTKPFDVGRFQYLVDEDSDSERDILIPKDLPSNNSLSFAEKESIHFDIPLFSRPPAKPPDGDTGILNIKMMGDISDQKAFMHKLMITLDSHQEKSPDLLSHRCESVTKFNTHRSHLNKCPMMINGQNNPPLDVLLFHFYPP
nr:hypothetical protein [Tanacetum cinerariifolium]